MVFFHQYSTGKRGYFQISVGTIGEGEGSRDREGKFQMKSYFASYMDEPMVRFKVREPGKGIHHDP
jgi:hypothetical protein